MPPSLLIGLVGAGLIALLAARVGALTTHGAVAATVIGGVVYWGGQLSWSLLLIFFFVSSSILSRFHHTDTSIALKGGRRDAWQVVANGGFPALWATVHAIDPSAVWLAPFAGAVAAATADTWATEVGSATANARLITTGRTVPAGTSGAVTLSGTAGSPCHCPHRRGGLPVLESPLYCQCSLAALPAALLTQ